MGNIGELRIPELKLIMFNLQHPARLKFPMIQIEFSFLINLEFQLFSGMSRAGGRVEHNSLIEFHCQIGVGATIMIMMIMIINCQTGVGATLMIMMMIIDYDYDYAVGVVVATNNHNYDDDGVYYALH